MQELQPISTRPTTRFLRARIGAPFRIKLAPLSVREGRPRCLVSLVDRPWAGGADLRAGYCDSLTGLLNRLSFTETIEIKGSASLRLQYAVLVVDMLRFSASTVDGAGR
jgi:GGDEF domain-containing protein